MCVMSMIVVSLIVVTYFIHRKALKKIRTIISFFFS